MDLGKKPVRDFTAQALLESHNPQHDPSLQSIEATQEGLQDDKNDTSLPTILPAQLLPKSKKPTHHKLDIIRAIGYTMNKQGILVHDLALRAYKS